MDAQSDIIETVRNFALEVKNHGVKLNRIFLYGSYARNLQNAHSDIDVARILKQATPLLKKSKTPVLKST